MIVPALVYFAIAGGTGPKGWAIPTATDIAFALAVLAVISTHLPAALRTFLLTLAVVDDLLAITVIALFYSKDLHLQWLLLAFLPLAVFTLLVQRGISHWYLLLPLAFATWALVHASGVHATVAGVLLGFMVPVKPLSLEAYSEGFVCASGNMFALLPRKLLTISVTPELCSEVNFNLGPRIPITLPVIPFTSKLAGMAFVTSGNCAYTEQREKQAVIKSNDIFFIKIF